jgi:hypothetical protein
MILPGLIELKNFPGEVTTPPEVILIVSEALKPIGNCFDKTESPINEVVNPETAVDWYTCLIS